MIYLETIGILILLVILFGLTYGEDSE